MIPRRDIVPRALLLNPPSRRPVFRDHYHSQHAKAAYAWQPVDLLVQSGHLARDFEVHLIDAVADRLDFAEAMRRALALRPDVVFTLLGEVCRDEDALFLARLRERLPGARVVGAGDVVQYPEGGDPFAGFPGLDGVLTSMLSPTLSAFLRGGRSAHVWTPGGRRPGRLRGKHFDYPTPALDLFIDPRYRLPLYGGRDFHSLTLSTGCPFRCEFCIVPDFPRQTRDLAGVWAELDAVRARGVRDLYVRDACFGFDREHAQAFCEGLIRRGSPFRWNTFTRVDFLTDALLALLVRAGCFMVHLGVESYDDAILERARKRLRLDEVAEGFARCRRAGLQASAHFVLGLDAGDADGERRLMATVRRLRPDHTAFSVYQARRGLSDGARSRARDAGADARLAAMQRRLTRRVYTRPGFLLRQLGALREPANLGNVARAARSLLLPPDPPAALRAEPAVSVVRCADYATATVERALDGALAPFRATGPAAAAGETILIKPNLLRAAAPDAAVTTHPEVVRACIRAVRAAGGVPAVGDLPAVHEGAGKRAAAEQAGLLAVCAEEGCEWWDIADRGFRSVELGDGRRVRLSRRALEADGLWTVGKLKTHFVTGGTATVKNLFGCVAPADRRRLHVRLSPRRFASMLAALVRALPVRLAVLDAVVGMEGAGPGQGTPRPLGLLLAGPDPVAVDRVAAHVSGMDRQRQVVLDAAGGIGENRLERVLVLGEPLEAVRRSFALPRRLPLPALDALSRLHFSTFEVTPRIDPARCIRCGTCQGVCTTGAISLHPTPRVDRSRCVSCFCCHEVCPERAIGERHGRLARLWLKLR